MDSFGAMRALSHTHTCAHLCTHKERRYGRLLFFTTGLIKDNFISIRKS